jgi:Ca2+-binding RTX toxin-like protein
VLLGEGGDDLLIGGVDTDVCRGGGGRDVARRCETVT